MYWLAEFAVNDAQPIQAEAQVVGLHHYVHLQFWRRFQSPSRQEHMMLRAPPEAAARRGGATRQSQAAASSGPQREAPDSLRTTRVGIAACFKVKALNSRSAQLAPTWNPIYNMPSPPTFPAARIQPAAPRCASGTSLTTPR